MTQYEILSINQSTDVSIDLYLIDENKSPKNLTGYQVAAKMSISYDAIDSDKISFLGIVRSPAADGIVNLSLTNAITAELNPKKRYVYDVELSHVNSETSATVVERVLEGLITVNPSVTR
jgi:hypothetical protein